MPAKKAIARDSLVGIWQWMTSVPGVTTKYALREDGKAEQIIQLGEQKPISQRGTWRFDGDQKWIVTLKRDGRMTEEIEFDVVKLGPSQMQCTNWDDDAIIYRFKRVKS